MRIVAGITGLLLSVGPALAQDLIVYGGAELEFTHNEDGRGTGIDSYIRPYIEAEMSGFYVGAQGKISDESAENRVDVYLGYRNETTGGLSYGLGVTRYNYLDDSSSNYSELFGSLGMSVGDKLSTSLDVYYDTTNELGSAYLGAALTVTDKLEASFNVGTYEVDGASNEEEWDFGATYSLGDTTSVDFRFYDGTEYETGYFGLSLNWDATLLGG